MNFFAAMKSAGGIGRLGGGHPVGGIEVKDPDLPVGLVTAPNCVNPLVDVAGDLQFQIELIRPEPRDLLARRGRSDDVRGNVLRLLQSTRNALEPKEPSPPSGRQVTSPIA